MQRLLQPQAGSVSQFQSLSASDSAAPWTAAARLSVPSPTPRAAQTHPHCRRHLNITLLLLHPLPCFPVLGKKEEEIIIDPLICFNACKQKGQIPPKYGTDLNLSLILISKMALIHSSVLRKNSPSRSWEVHKFSEAKRQSFLFSL